MQSRGWINWSWTSRPLVALPCLGSPALNLLGVSERACNAKGCTRKRRAQASSTQYQENVHVFKVASRHSVRRRSDLRRFCRPGRRRCGIGRQSLQKMQSLPCIGQRQASGRPQPAGRDGPRSRHSGGLQVFQGHDRIRRRAAASGTRPRSIPIWKNPRIWYPKPRWPSPGSASRRTGPTSSSISSRTASSTQGPRPGAEPRRTHRVPPLPVPFARARSVNFM